MNNTRAVMLTTAVGQLSHCTLQRAPESMTETDTCREFVVPLLQKAGWGNDPHYIDEQRYFTTDYIISKGPTAHQLGKRADCLLRYTCDLPLNVVEAKAAYKHSAESLQQTNDYATQEEIDTYGKVKDTKVITPEEPEDKGLVIRNFLYPVEITKQPPDQFREYYFDDYQVEIAMELIHALDADVKQRYVVKFTDYTVEKMRILCSISDELRTSWDEAVQCSDIIHELAECGVDFASSYAQSGQPDTYPFDLLCYLACRTSRQDGAPATSRILRPRQLSCLTVPVQPT